MPSSKRAKVVHLSKNPSSAAQKKTCKIQARKLYDNIRQAITRYAYAYVFAVDNMRNTYLKDVRSELVDSRYVICLWGFYGSMVIILFRVGENICVPKLPLPSPAASSGREKGARGKLGLEKKQYGIRSPRNRFLL